MGGLSFVFLLEPVEPVAHDLPQAIGVEDVDALAARLLDGHQARLFEAPEVTGRRRPRAREALGDVSSRHAAAAEAEDDEDVPAARVSECAEDLLEIVELGLAARLHGGNI